MGGLKQQARAAEQSVARSGRLMAAAGRSAATGGGLMGRMKTGLQGVTTAQKGLNTAMKSNVFGLVLALLMPLIMKLVDMAMQSRTVQRIVQSAFRIIGQVINTTMRVARQVVQASWNAIRTAFTVVLRVLSTVVRTYFTIYRTIITTAFRVIRVVVQASWNAIRTAFTVVLRVLSTVVRTYFTIYKTIITTAVRAITAVIRPLLDFFSQRVPAAFRAARNGIQGALRGLANIVRGAFSAVVGAVRGPINGVIGLVNRAIGALNRIKVSIPSWVPPPAGGKSFGVNLPTIPTLAGGGIVLPRPGGTLALLAEAGQAEAVLPLRRLNSLLAAGGGARTVGPGSSGGHGGFVIEHYHEAPGSSARQTAEELMFLMKARG